MRLIGDDGVKLFQTLNNLVKYFTLSGRLPTKGGNATGGQIAPGNGIAFNQCNRNPAFGRGTCGTNTGNATPKYGYISPLAYGYLPVPVYGFDFGYQRHIEPPYDAVIYYNESVSSVNSKVKQRLLSNTFKNLLHIGDFW